MQLSEVFCRLCTQATDSSRRFAATQTDPAHSFCQNKWPSQTFVGQVVDAPIRFEMVFSPEFSEVICAPRFCRRLFCFLLAVFSPAGDFQVRAACKSSSWLCADAWEFTQQEWSRSLLVLRRFGCSAFIIIVCASFVLQRPRKAVRDDERARS